MKRLVLTCVTLAGLLCLVSIGQSQVPGIPALPGADTGLISVLGKAMGGATTAQSQGAAGSIFGLAKSRLSPDEFSKVSNSVPGMDGLLKAAPDVGALPPTGLDSIDKSFAMLGLKPEMVSKAIPAVTNYVSRTGGKDVGKMLSGVLK